MADDTQTPWRETRADYPVGTRVRLGSRTQAVRATVVQPTRDELANETTIRVRHDNTGHEETWRLNLDDIERVAPDADADGAQCPDDDVRAWPIGTFVELENCNEADGERWHPARVVGHEVPGVLRVTS